MDCREPRLTILKGGPDLTALDANGAARSDFLATWSALQFDGTPFGKT